MEVHMKRISNMLQLLAVMILVFSQSGQTQVEDFNCYYDCRFDISSQNGATCEEVDFSLTCYDENFFLCFDNFDVGDVYDIVVSAVDTCGAGGDPATDQSECPNPPPYVMKDPTVDLEKPDISPESHSCNTPEYYSMRQCSMFGYSHMRPFKEYRTGLETCTVPGEWYLLKHTDFSVMVESTAAPGCNHTMLTKVNVTFSTSQCSEEKSYVATADSALPSTFTDGQVPVNLNSGLQLKENGSVVTLLAVWIKTTIIIRRYMDTLSVTIQVPGEETWESEGLCFGCPAHAYFNIANELEYYRTTCLEQSNNSTYNCFVYPELTDNLDIESDSYDDYCIYDLMKTEQLETLTLLKAIGHDARMLPDEGIVPPKPSTRPVHTPPTTRATTAESTTDLTLVETDDIFSSSSRISPLSTLTISGLLLLVFLLR